MEPWNGGAAAPVVTAGPMSCCSFPDHYNYTHHAPRGCRRIKTTPRRHNVAVSYEPDDDGTTLCRCWYNDDNVYSAYLRFLRSDHFSAPKHVISVHLHPAAPGANHRHEHPADSDQEGRARMGVWHEGDVTTDMATTISPIIGVSTLLQSGLSIPVCRRCEHMDIGGYSPVATAANGAQSTKRKKKIQPTAVTFSRQRWLSRGRALLLQTATGGNNGEAIIVRLSANRQQPCREESNPPSPIWPRHLKRSAPSKICTVEEIPTTT